MFLPKIDFSKYPILVKFLEDLQEMILENELLMYEIRQVCKDYPIINSMLPNEIKKLLHEKKVKV